ncbi:MAG: hypothetical protein Q9181_004746 [Wetmoreana brouardii]
MHLQSLPNETLLQILHSLSSLQDVVALSLTSRRLHDLLSRPAQRLPILFDAAERQFGPLSSAIPVVTQNASQPPHIPRPCPPQSLALLKQILHVGEIANAWADLYPFIHWRGTDIECASRRLLTPHERFRVRRACYRSWLYSLAFHNASFPRYTRLQPPVARSRAALLRAWSTSELSELMDMQSVFRAVLELYVCPSNGTVILRHKERHGENSMPTVSLFQSYELKPHRGAVPGKVHIVEYWEGWGDDVAHYYVLEDMLKLHPGQIMKLYHFVNGAEAKFGAIDGPTPAGNKKAAVEAYVAALGEWFDNNGSTLEETVRFVMGERGEFDFHSVGSIVL